MCEEIAEIIIDDFDHHEAGASSLVIMQTEEPKAPETAQMGEGVAKETLRGSAAFWDQVRCSQKGTRKVEPHEAQLCVPHSVRRLQQIPFFSSLSTICLQG